MSVNEADVDPKQIPHQAASRRQRIQDLDKQYSQVVVRQGTQQASAIESIRDRARVFALTIEERCPPGPEREKAHRECMSAMLWALQAISHR